MLFYALFCLQPRLHDDMGFYLYMDDYNHSGAIADFIRNAKDALVSRYAWDNGRIPNLFGSVLILIPRGIMSIFLSAAFALMVVYGSKLIRAWNCSLLAYAVAVLGFVLVLPWYDAMYTAMFALNYVVPSAMILYSAWLIIYGPGLRPGIAFGLGLFFGLWHEAFAIAALGGLLGVAIMYPQWRNRNTACWASGFLLAVAFLGLAPATFYKGGGMLNLSALYKLNFGMLLGAPFYCFVLVTAFMMAFGKLRRQVLSPQLAFIFGAALGGWFIWRCFMTGLRNAWPMLMFAVLGIAAYVPVILQCAGAKFKKGLAWLMILMSFAQPLSTIPWFVQIRKEVADAKKIEHSTPEGEACFSDISSVFNVPLYTLNRPNFDNYNNCGFPWYKVAPSALKDFDPSKARPICSHDTAYFYDGYIVIPDNGKRSIWVCEVFFDEKPSPTACTITPFKTDAGNFCYISPEGIFAKAHLKTLTGLSLIRLRYAED